MVLSLTHNAVVHLYGKVVPPHDLQRSRVCAAWSVILVLHIIENTTVTEMLYPYIFFNNCTLYPTLLCGVSHFSMR